ncbi:MAG: DUF1801 domain-containing protein [Phycisphaerales bacterium]
MQSKAATVTEYLASLPADRRETISAVRALIKKNLDRGYGEGMSYGMIGYFVPHSIYPPGYHCDPKQPLPFAGLASQKGHMSLYLMGLYGNIGGEQRFRTAWGRTGKKLDMGKSCIRFKKLDDLALEVIADTVRETTVSRFIAHYEACIRTTNKAKAASPAKKIKAAVQPKGNATKKAKNGMKVTKAKKRD